MSGLGQAPTYATGLAAQSANAPREIGVLQRLDGIAAGLFELQEKLTMFGGRLMGDSSKSESCGGYPPGIASALSAAEERLRACHAMVDALHKTF